MECVEKIIKKDMIHPLTNQKLKEKDIIPMQRVIMYYFIKKYIYLMHIYFQGGTGYSQTNINLEGKHERPVLQA